MCENIKMLLLLIYSINITIYLITKTIKAYKLEKENKKLKDEIFYLNSSFVKQF